MFFVMVGVSLNLNTVDWSAPFVWQLAGLLMVVAIAGKWLAGFATREPRFVQTVIGLSMIPRGEVGLIFAQLGFANAILSTEPYAALRIVIHYTSVGRIPRYPPLHAQAIFKAMPDKRSGYSHIQQSNMYPFM